MQAIGLVRSASICTLCRLLLLEQQTRHPSTGTTTLIIALPTHPQLTAKAKQQHQLQEDGGEQQQRRRAQRHQHPGTSTRCGCSPCPSSYAKQCRQSPFWLPGISDLLFLLFTCVCWDLLGVLQYLCISPPTTLPPIPHFQVVVRCRPINTDEEKRGFVPIVSTDTERRQIKINYGQGMKKVSRSFTYDRVFGRFATQEDVYKQTVAPMVDEMLAGFSCTCFAYGQTGTGTQNGWFYICLLSIHPSHPFPNPSHVQAKPTRWKAS